MNAEIKRHIDSARQVLVGVVPNPTSQIDQITNALIYKFMDDMDQGAIKVGGEPSFFVGDLEKYAWTRLIDTRTGNQEKMNLYSEALVKFSESEQLPELFRNIFKSAFLPYRSPEVLGLFLKEINYFDYSHPEDLGDAYEYLLSIMSSQGDAGQFRTPRHIIDFIVEVVKPTKDDKVLDPACGTAGFLISAYKHILKQHDGLDDPEKKEKPLTPDDRKNLMNNFEGYDIDPGMVRIAQVNMYLHQFRNPKIVQYDSLSMDERWNDKFDVILANPPFMSPKGGIKPHSKFSVHSNRSEVLFVDYIMNHLRPRGRAGVIVPEGIIFQSGTAYKQLRKNLVNDGLYAVVSLPSGVFNPYAGVKTSILLLDNDFAKTVNEILFVKIDNDGFDLGAQRKPIGKSDLPEALRIIGEWMNGNTIKNQLAHSVKKSKIIESDDYNLSGDRYKETKAVVSAWTLESLENIFDEIKNGKNVNQFDEPGNYRVSRIQTIAHGIVDLSKTKFTNDNVKDEDFLKEGDILFSHINSIEHLAKTALFTGIYEKVVHGANLLRLRPNKLKVLPEYAIFIFKSEHFLESAKKYAQKAVNQASINSKAVKSLYIPLPPIEVQEHIVAELDGYQKIIDGAKMIEENWKPIIKCKSDWPLLELNRISKINNTLLKPEYDRLYQYIDIASVSSDGKIKLNTPILGKELPSRARRKVQLGDVIISTVRPNLKSFAYIDFVPENVVVSTGFAVISPNSEVLGLWIYYLMLSENLQNQMKARMGKGAYPSINQADVENLKIPLPHLDIQKEITESIDVENKIVKRNRELIRIFKNKIANKIKEVWGE